MAPTVSSRDPISEFVDKALSKVEDHTAALATLTAKQDRNLVDVAELQRGSTERAQHIALIEQSGAERDRRESECRLLQAESWKKIWAELRVLTDDLHSTVQALKLHVEAADNRQKTFVQLYGPTLAFIGVLLTVGAGLWVKSGENHKEIVASETRIMGKLDEVAQTQSRDDASARTSVSAAKSDRERIAGEKFAAPPAVAPMPSK